MRNVNFDLLVSAARLLRPLLDELVFVGGCATGLLITDPAAADVRPTLDVDVIVEVTSYAKYVGFGERLRHIGFHEDTGEEAPVCRWIHGRIRLDVMPLDEKVLGFSNRWYKAAVRAAVAIAIERGLRIRVVTAPYFLATKLEAFRGRGNEDFFGSHDLEDLIAVVDGRPELVDETATAPRALRSYVAAEVQRLLRNPRFVDALPGHLLPDMASQARLGILIPRFEGLAAADR